MKNKVLLFLLTLIAFFCFGGIMVSASQTISNKEFYLITTTPGVDASKEISFNWHTNSTGSYLYYYKALDGEEKGVKVNPDTEVIWSTKEETNVDPNEKFYKERYVCSLSLKDLDERTKYCYYIANEQYKSDIHSFITAGLTNNWEFMAFVDFQNPDNTNTKKIINTVKSFTCDPTLAICSGDLTGCGGNQDEFEWVLNGNFDDLVFASAPGDHEYWANDKGSPYPMFSTPFCFNAIFNNPKNGCNEALNSNYYFYYNNVLFIALDMCDSNTSKSAKLDAEAAWFKNTMKNLAGTYQYCVVFEHKSIYGSQQEDSGVRKYIGPVWQALFDEYKVDLAIGGHDHMYSRTYQIYKGKVTTDKNLGTFYLDMGSSGDKYRTPSADLTSDKLHEKVMDLKELKYAVGARIIVSDEKMKVEVINMNGVKVDEFEIESKREPLEFNLTGFNKNEFVENISINATNLTQANFVINDSKNLKYIKSIALLDKNNSEVLNTEVQINKDQEYKLTKINGIDYKVKITLLTGESLVVNKQMDLGTIKNLNAKLIDDVLFLTFENSVTPISNTLFRLTIDGVEEMLSANDVKKGNAKIELDDKYIYGEHNYKLELIVSGEIKESLDLTHTEKEDLKLITSNNIEVNTKDGTKIEFEYSDPSSVLIISSNPEIAKIEDGKIIPVKNGKTTIILSIGDLQKEINVTVNMPSKMGYNSGNVIEIITSFVIVFISILGVATLTSFKRKKYNC